MKPLFRGLVMVILGIVGGGLAVVAWLALGRLVVSFIDDAYYPGGPGGLPSDEQFLSGCFFFLGIPWVALAGGVLTVRLLGRIERSIAGRRV